MKIYIQLLLYSLLTSCGGKKVEIVKSQKCNSEVKITKYKTGLGFSKGEGKLVEKGEHFYIYFTESYENDMIQAYINGKSLFDEIVSTDESLGTTEKGFYYKYGDDSDPVVFKVIKNGKSCFDITLDKNFRQIFIYSNKNKWEVIYDNIYPLYE